MLALIKDTKFIIGGLMVMVVLMSFFVFSNQSLRLDESQSLWQTSFSVPRMLQIVAGDVHVPFYHILLHYWQVFLGNDVATARMMSLVFFALTIPAIYLLGQITYGRKIAIFASILTAISPFLNWYGNEVRMYSLLVFLTVWNQYFFLKIYKTQKENRSGIWFYGITAILGAFTHYFFIFQLVAQGIFYLFYNKSFNWQILKRIVVIGLVLVVLLEVWFLYVYSLRSMEFSRPLLAEPTTYNLFDSVTQFVFGFQEDHLNALIIALWPVSILVAFLSLNKNKAINPNTSFFFLSIAVPILLSFVISITVQPLFLSRYLILTVPSLYLFLGWLFSNYSKKVARAAQIATISVMALMLYSQSTQAELPIKENFKVAAEYLNANSTPNDVIIVSAPFTIYPIEYYYLGPSTITTLPTWNRFSVGAIPDFSEEKLDKEAGNLKSRYDKGWLLLSYDQGYEAKVKFYFDTHFERLEQHEFSPGITLQAYKFRYEQSAGL